MGQLFTDGPLGLSILVARRSTALRPWLLTDGPLGPVSLQKKAARLSLAANLVKPSTGKAEPYRTAVTIVR